MTTDTANIDYTQTGNRTLDLDVVSVNDGDITIDNSGTTAANITIADLGISAGGAGNTVMITTTGAIGDDQLNPNTTTDITAAVIDLNAATGIGVIGAQLRDVDLAGQTISADTTAGAITLNNVSATPVAVTSLTTTLSDITFNQTGAVVATFGTAAAGDEISTTGTGAIFLNAEDGIDIAGLVQTVGVDITIDADTDAPPALDAGKFSLLATGTLDTGIGGGNAVIRAADFDFLGTLTLGTGSVILTLSQQRSLCLGDVTSCAKTASKINQGAGFVFMPPTLCNCKS